MEGDGERVRAGVGGRDEGRVYDVHVRAQIAHVGAEHLWERCVQNAVDGWLDTPYPIQNLAGWHRHRAERATQRKNTTHLEHMEGPTTPGRIAVESARWHVEHESFAHRDKGEAFCVGATLELSVSARPGWHPGSMV